MTLQALIDKQDNIEIIRDKIAQILANETASQQTLATAAGKDSELWKFLVFRERSNILSRWQNNSTDETPVVNVWFDSETFNGGNSGVIERQTTNANINIDIYTRAVAKATVDGHSPSDMAAALRCAAVTRLVRNILMAAEYTYLELQGIVGQRWPSAITSFQPQEGGQAVESIHATRITLAVSFNELSPQYEGAILELITVGLTLSPSGEVIPLEYPH